MRRGDSHATGLAAGNGASRNAATAARGGPAATAISAAGNARRSDTVEGGGAAGASWVRTGTSGRHAPAWARAGHTAGAQQARAE